MPRKLLSDCDRGWYGWEGKTSSVLRRSNCVLWDCRRKMDLEKFRHQHEMDRLETLLREEQKHSRKALRSVQDEYSRIRAERKVLQHHAFRKYDPLYEDPPPPPQPSPLPLPRRPLTERIVSQRTVPKDCPVKPKSLPTIRTVDSGLLTESPVTSSGKTSGLRLSSYPVTASPKMSAAADSRSLTTSLTGSASLGSVPSLVGVRRGRGAWRTESRSGSGTKGSFFLTDSEIIASSVLEEEEKLAEDEEEEGEEEVFHDHQDHPLIHNTLRRDRHGTSDKGDVIRGPEVPTGDAAHRAGSSLKVQQPFHSIDYILGARKQSARAPGTLTSTHLAKPSTPKGTVRPSRPTSPDTAAPAADTSSNPLPSTSRSGRLTSIRSLLGDHTPPPEGAVTQTEGVVTQREGVVTQTEGVVTQTEGVVTQTEGVVTHTQGVVTHTEGVVKSKAFLTEGPRLLRTDVSHSSKNPGHCSHHRDDTTRAVQQPPAANKEHTNTTLTAQVSSSSSLPQPSEPENRELITPTLQNTKSPLTRLSALSTSHSPEPSSTQGEPAEPAPAPKLSLLSRFRQAAEVIVEEKRVERESNISLFAALLNRPQRQLKVRALEKPQSVAEQEQRNLWKSLLMNVQHAVRWKVKTLRESQGIPNTRQMRRKAREQQESKERMRRHVFPGHCRTTYAMKKFLSREVEDLVEAGRPENRRKTRNKLMKHHTDLPNFVDRVRSTTAILRDFKQYQSSHDAQEDLSV